MGEPGPVGNLSSTLNLLKRKPFSSWTYKEKYDAKNKRCTPNLDIKYSDGKVTRKFVFSWYTRYSWLTGCSDTNKLFCYTCILFGGEKEWTLDGIAVTKNFLRKAEKHRHSNKHIQNEEEFNLLGRRTIGQVLSVGATVHTDLHKRISVPETGKTPEKEARSDESWLEENEFNPGLKVEDCGDLDSEEVCHPQSLTEQEHTEHPSCSSFADVEFALLHLHQEKLLLELEKLSEERERIATEKKNVILHSEILKLRLQLMGCSRSAQMGINCGSNNVGTENFPENVNVSVPSHSVQQFQNSSTDKPKSSGSALGTEPKLTQTSITTGSIHAENPLIKINRPPNMNSTSIYKQSSSTSNYSVSFQPNKRPVLSDTVKNSCGLPVDIPSSASHFLAPLIDIDIRTVTPSMTHLNIVQTGINNGKTSEISRSPQVGLIPQDYKSQQQRLLCAKPTPQSMPTTNSKDVLAVSPTLKAGSNPPPVASNKTILHQMVNSSQLNSPSQLERSRKAQESTDDFIVLHSKDSSVEWKKGVFVSSSDSTAGSVPRVKEKVDIESPSKKLRLSTEDSR